MSTAPNAAAKVSNSMSKAMNSAAKVGNSVNKATSATSDFIKNAPNPFTGSSVVSILIQIALALVLILILYIISLFMVNTDALVIFKDDVVKRKETTDIFKGFIGASRLVGTRFNTINPYTENFIKIPRSINTKGGAQFTYQFWMRLNDTNINTYKDKVIFLKGDPRQYVKQLYNKKTLERVPFDPEIYNSTKRVNSPDYMIKCPLIKFGNDCRHLIIEFNTNKDPSVRMETNVENTNNGYRQNLSSLMVSNWFLITYVIIDNYSYVQSSENGIQVILYINEIPYQTASAATDPLLSNNHLRQNDGSLCFFPNTISNSGDFMKISDMKYFNYAVTPAEVTKTFNKGPSKYEAKLGVAEDRKNQPLFLSAYNKVDVYNY